MYVKEVSAWHSDAYMVCTPSTEHRQHPGTYTPFAYCSREQLSVLLYCWCLKRLLWTSFQWLHITAQSPLEGHPTLQLQISVEDHPMLVSDWSFFIQFFTIFRFSLFCSIRKVWQSVVHMLALIGLCNSKVQNSRYNQLPLRIQAIYIHIPVYIDSE